MSLEEIRLLPPHVSNDLRVSRRSPDASNAHLSSGAPEYPMRTYDVVGGEFQPLDDISTARPTSRRSAMSPYGSTDPAHAT